MKSSKLLLLFLTVTFLYSCQKEKSPDNNSRNLRLKTYSESLQAAGNSFKDLYQVNYDNEGRVASLVSTASSGDKFEFGYPASTRRTVDVFNQGSRVIHADLFMNNHSDLDSLFQYNDEQDSSYTKYLYDAGRKLTAIKDYEYTRRSGGTLTNTTNFSYNSAGDMIRSVDSEGTEILYEYYPGQVYEMPVILDFSRPENLAKSRLVKKRLVKEDNTVVLSVQHTYTFDSQERITTDKAVFDNGAIVTKTYTYL